MRLWIESGPHQGPLDWPDAPDRLELIDPPPTPRRPASRQRYVRVRAHPDDFVRGVYARYRWDP